MSLDKEMAQAFMQSTDSDEEPDNRPLMSTDSQISMGLRDIGNQVRLMRMEYISSKGGNPSAIRMLEGPKTVIEEAAFTRRQLDHYKLTARLLPHKADEMQAKIDALGG